MEFYSRLVNGSMDLHNKYDSCVKVTPVHDNVTGSAHICTAELGNGKTFSFIVDCGCFQAGEEEKNSYFPFYPENIAFALVTHAHTDHIGRLPFLVKNGFSGKIYTSSLTKALMRPSLINTSAILMQDAKSNSSKKSNVNLNESEEVPLSRRDYIAQSKEKALCKDYFPVSRSEHKSLTKENENSYHFRPHKHPAPILLASKKPAKSFYKNNFMKARTFVYSSVDVERTLNLTVGCNYLEEVVVHPNVKVTFLPNRHILGAAMILVKVSCIGKEDTNFLFTGDYADSNSFFNVSDIPEEIRNLPLNIVIESTYGTTLSENINKTFKDNIIKACKERKDIVLPVFALQRAQQGLLAISELQRDMLIDSDILVVLDSKLARDYNSIFENSCSVPFLPNNLVILDRKSRETFLSNTNGPKIILAASGMCSYGPVTYYIKKFISNKNALIHLMGYSAEGSLSRRIRESSVGDTVNVCGVPCTRLCEVNVTGEFSSHAPKDKLLSFLKKFPNLHLVLVNHGEQASKKAFAEYIAKELPNVKHVAIESSERVSVVTSNGLQKTFPSKF